MELTELIESIDILDYISQYTEFTEKNGEYWALSPLKDEKTPSFSVRKETNSFYDFSSGVGGNVLTFVRFYNKCGYHEAIEILKNYAGVDGEIRPHRKLAATEVARKFAKPKKSQPKGKSVTLPDDYMERYEKREDSVMEWWHKKCAIEEAGMKYIHAVEAYLTEDLTEKIRDNYHCVLIAKNYEGFLELNSLVSQSFNRKDNHFYYAPRISFDELFSTSDNILITTACVGGVFGKGDNATQKKFLEFMTAHKERCFFEVGHHLDDKQVSYNKRMYDLSTITGIPLIAGTDTHVLNEEHEKGRSIEQQNHPSETALDDSKPDIYIHNAGTLNDLRQTVSEIVTELNGHHQISFDEV